MKALFEIQAVLDEYPSEIGVIPVFMTGRDGQVTLSVSVIAHGDDPQESTSHRHFTTLAGTETLASDTIAFRDTLDTGEIWPWGKHWVTATRTIHRIDHAAVNCFHDAIATMPPNCILFLHDLHGAATRVAPAATAFTQRQEHYVIGIASRWEPGDDRNATVQRAWVDGVSARLEGISIPGGYVNFLHPDAGDRVRLFYGPNAERLHAIKRRIDPLDRFRCTTGRF